MATAPAGTSDRLALLAAANSDDLANASAVLVNDPVRPCHLVARRVSERQLHRAIITFRTELRRQGHNLPYATVQDAIGMMIPDLKLWRFGDDVTWLAICHNPTPDVGSDAPYSGPRLRPLHIDDSIRELTIYGSLRSYFARDTSRYRQIMQDDRKRAEAGAFGKT